MKLRNIFFLLLTLAAIGLSSCEQDLPVWDDNQGYLNFAYNGDGDSLVSYSFNFHHGVERDTVWLSVKTSGKVATVDRYYQIEQLPTTGNDAVAGKHYVSFDDADYQQLLCVKADSTEARLPIIVLKDASLADSDVVLKIAIRPTKDFLPGQMQYLYKTLTISNRLTKPTNWNQMVTYYFGTYGPVKHQFMIDNTPYAWDDAFLLSLGVDNWATCDQGYLGYLQGILNQKLMELNYQRALNGEGPLSEADGSVVKFSQW